MINQRSLIRFGLPLMFQLGLIAAIPAQAIYTQLTGTSVILKTIPVDPYDLLRGYSQTLRYEISQVEELETLTGWERLQGQTQTSLPQGTPLYVILQAPDGDSSHPTPRSWEPIAVREERPVNLEQDQIAIQGEVNSSWVNYGIEKYYFPEQKREQINREINLARQDNEDNFFVEVKVDERGNAVPISLWIGDRNYRF